MKIAEIKKNFLKDQRKSDRISIPIVFYMLGPDNKWIGPIPVDNISGHGLKFSSSKEIDKNTKLNLKLIFPEENNKPINVNGIVRWCSKSRLDAYNIGISFDKMNYEDRKKFVNYIGEKLLLKISNS